MLLSLLLLLRLLVGLIALCGSVLAVSANENDAADDVAVMTGWMQGCRRAGFDPWHLACVTCDLMPSDETKQKCLECCQSYKDIVLTGGGRFDKPHESAILVLPKGMPVPEEVQKLLDDNWNELVETKGSDRLVQMELLPRATSALDMQRFLYPAPTFIHFFDEEITESHRSATSAATIADAAKESISLQGWKREDIKDMLQTMLP